eukprot:scaffold278109_cov46-Prasinocladus_malaysianus.AAC.1
MFGICPYSRTEWQTSVSPVFKDVLQEKTGIDESSIMLGSDWDWGTLQGCSCRLWTRVFAVLKTYDKDEADKLAKFVSASDNILKPMTEQADVAECSRGLKVAVRKKNEQCFD